jgi:hypothetical protein
MGIDPSHKNLDIAFIYGLYPQWADCGWIPVSGDGCGSYYVVVSQNDFGDGEPVVFVDTMDGACDAAFIVASCSWHFVRFILLKERGESRWPFAAKEVIEADPDITHFSGVDLPWDGRRELVLQAHR